MLLFAKIAWRNITRNLRRTLITLTAISCGLASIVIFFGVSDGFHTQWVYNTVKIYSGHIKIHANGYIEERNLNRGIKDLDLINNTLDTLPGVEIYTHRIHIQGLASTPESSSTAIIRGIDPEVEARISELDKRIIEGTYISNDEHRGILLGQKLAKQMNAKIGEKIVLMVQAADGSLGAELFRLKGIFRIGAADLDRLLAVITLQDAQELAVLGETVTESVIIVSNTDDVGPISQALNEKLGPQGYEAYTWDEVLPQSKEMLDLSTVFMFVVLGIVLTLVALGILNTMLMSIMERTREFGIMMAMGTRPTQIILLVILESLFLGLVGVSLGVAIGISVNSLVAINGINLAQWSSAMDLVSSLYPVIYPTTNMLNVSIAAIATFVMTILVSIYPAIRAARLQPVKAIRTV